MFLKWLSILLQVFVVVNAARPLITIRHGGQLEGIYQTTLGNRTVSAFLGVPYGTAERFSNPKPAQGWTGVRDAGSPTPFCLQYNYFAALPTDPTEQITGVEDCLMLDVLTPTNPQIKAKLLPVVVMIPSGSFVSLGARAFGGKFLLDRDVVYVSLNSRVGILGFMSTGDDAIPGNFGLKDQALALRWIKDNIQVFGGDPNRVTLIGESSGAACVHAHYFSPLSRGLFHGGIAMSGSMGNYWAIMDQPQHKAQQLGTLLNCTNVHNSYKLRECLLSKDGKEILAQFEHFTSEAATPFPPVVEAMSQGAFLTEAPLKMIVNRQTADLPLILTTVRGEGLITTAAFLADPSSLQTLVNSWNVSAPTPAVLDYEESVLPNHTDFVSYRVKEQYQIDSTSHELFARLTHALTDRSMVTDLMYTALLQAHYHTAPVFSSLFNYFGSANSGTLIGATLDQLKPYGPCHGDDIAYISDTSYLHTANTPRDIAMVETMVDFVISFASTGKPKANGGSEWKPISKSGLESLTVNYLKINSASDLKMVEKINMGHSNFWHFLPLNEPIVRFRKGLEDY